MDSDGAVEILVQLASLQLGIFSLDDPFDKVNKQMLARLPPDEARKAKRKFRKLWRKQLDKKLGNKSERNQRMARRGIQRFKGTPPTTLERRKRRLLVYYWLLNQLQPVLDRAPKVVPRW